MNILYRFLKVRMNMIVGGYVDIDSIQIQVLPILNYTIIVAILELMHLIRLKILKVGNV